MNPTTNSDRPVPMITAVRCDGCGLCVRVCPKHALGLVARKAVVLIPEACDYLGDCERICPVQAIARVFHIHV